jgi:hypothetical protein
MWGDISILEDFAASIFIPKTEIARLSKVHSLEKVERYILMEYTFFKCIPCDFEYIIVLDVNLFQIQV